jgi:hypothetical protein
MSRLPRMRACRFFRHVFFPQRAGGASAIGQASFDGITELDAQFQPGVASSRLSEAGDSTACHADNPSFPRRLPMPPSKKNHSPQSEDYLCGSAQVIPGPKNRRGDFLNGSVPPRARNGLGDFPRSAPGEFSGLRRRSFLGFLAAAIGVGGDFVRFKSAISKSSSRTASDHSL